MVSSKYTTTSFRPFGIETDKTLGEVTEYQASEFNKESRPTYSKIKETFKAVKKKDQRFMLSELVAGQLSVEEEDQKRFEERLKVELEARTIKIKEDAYQDGYNKGLEKGVEKAFDEERARIAARLEALALITNDIADAKASLEAAYEKQLSNFAFQIAEGIVESELAQRPESVLQVIKNVLELLSKEEDVKIYVGTAAKEHRDYLKEEISKVNRKGSFVLEIKDSLSAGDCLVESISGEVSAKIQEKISLFRKEIMAQFERAEVKKAV